MVRPYALLLAATALSAAAQTTHTISTSNSNVFNPATVNAVVGDEIHLIITGNHTFTEVDEATWNDDGTTSNGGHDYSGGEHFFTLDEPGTIYFVCVPHASMGMKGRIIVTDATGVDEMTRATAPALFPNPASSTLQLDSRASAGVVRIELIDMRGARVLNSALPAGRSIDVSGLPNGSYSATAFGADDRVLFREHLTVQH